MIKVQREDFDVGAELRALAEGNHGVGAICSFTGLVRDMAGGEQIGAMTLEHYPGMTEKELAAIEEEARRRWPLEAALIIHRFGGLEPGDRIVLCAAASAHRAASFDACEFMMDFLKTKAPFWKLEDTKRRGGRWADARDSDNSAAERWVRFPGKAAE